MTIYERPAKSLLVDWANEYLTPGQKFAKDDAARWFAQHYPKIKGATVNMHRKHYPSIRPGSGHDLFYKLGPDEYRLWRRDADPAPFYKQDFDVQSTQSAENRARGNGHEGEAIVDSAKVGIHDPRLGHSLEGHRQSQGVFVGIRKVAAKLFEFTRRVKLPQTKNDLDLASENAVASVVKSEPPHPALAHPVLTAVTDRNESQTAFENLRETFRKDAQIFPDHSIGWQSGSCRRTAYWLANLGVWAVLEPFPSIERPRGRFWNCFGVSNPAEQQMLKITVEINPPHEGENRRVGGLFVRDKDNRIYLAHKWEGGRRAARHRPE
jgi:hypothetical protein